MPENPTGFLPSAPLNGSGVGESSSGGSSRRSLGCATLIGGQTLSGLIEWVTGEPDHALLSRVGERIPNGDDGEWRPEEAHTLRIHSTFRDGDRTAVVYACSSKQRPTDLRDVMLTTPKPSSADRRAFGRIIATQIRSLHVHFQIIHPMLRTESFAFFSPSPSSSNAAEPLDLSRPYILDWGYRVSSSSSGLPTTVDMFQHPGYRASALVTPQWFNQAWALMMILTEIADWRPIEGGPFRDEAALREATLQRGQLVTDESWKNSSTAAIFRYGFAFLDHKPEVLAQYSHWQIKRFYDRLCQLLAPTETDPPQ
ncbi:hypothetical protein SPI_03813 [Niveomyces insectorum RCEF 264]|uniref:Protein kinase-like domain protein n=1 Tax=Niveomyces insectorum RCEF 264 TaxID=1081102 RepID=A0A162ML98_9HYPO|nr:hypothetical protein SPI_03813 [Niveomyces insectorum RCEF 264]